jgi:hypothetical protein
MKKFRCSHAFGPGKYTYYVDVIADSEGHAKEMASACVREKSTFSSSVSPEHWNVSVVDTGCSGPAKVVDYSKH